MTDDLGRPGPSASDEMSEYLQVFLDETDEQLEGLVETLLVLEREPTRADALNEAFRLIHSIKGSAGMMGFDHIAMLTHHLENRFEAFRSGSNTLDRPTMNLVLRCIDFLRECARRLRAGETLGSAGELVRELESKDVETDAAASPAPPPAPSPPPPPAGSEPITLADDAMRIVVVFEPDLPLADLKARLIVTRLSARGEIASTLPDVAALETVGRIDRFEIALVTEEDPETIRAAVDLDGVQSVELHGGATGAEAPAEDVASPEVASPDVETPPAPAAPAEPAPAEEAPAPERSRPGVAETIRVDIDRLDRLMNLAGELVVNRARFAQVTGRIGSSFRNRNVAGQVRDFAETLRRTIEALRSSTNGQWTSRIEELEAGLAFLEEQSERWDRDRRGFAQIGEAVDQLTRIADSLQQGVLDTRMVPVAPLFNRFKRVVRDLSAERDKKVDLEIHGEKTELDKRMIDELGDPLVHLVRNCLDHGLETPEVRRERGKPETGTIRLEASHRGNSVYVAVGDDGGGIDVARIREKIVERGLQSATEAAALSDDAVLDHIWHAGFSTATTVTDISGRGVGMDVVRKRIADLSGTIDVQSTAKVGTRFTIRLPLTLAIINSLLVRIRETIFSIPIDDVREIVSVPAGDIVTVRRKHAIDVRGEYIPLIAIDDVFDRGRLGADNGHDAGQTVAAVILQVGDRTMGLRVDEPLGSQDIVIKSLAENFVPIRGLSGASILGDGTVCLMIDAGTLIEMATRGSSPSTSMKETRP